jgi:hypothetical protein
MAVTLLHRGSPQGCLQSHQGFLYNRVLNLLKSLENKQIEISDFYAVLYENDNFGMTHFNDRWSSSMVLTMESSRMIHGECVP